MFCSNSMIFFALLLTYCNFNSGYLGSHPVWEKVRKTHWKYVWKYVLILAKMSFQYTTLCKHLEIAFALEWFMIKYKISKYFTRLVLCRHIDYWILFTFHSNIVIWRVKISRRFMAFFKISCWNTSCKFFMSNHFVKSRLLSLFKLQRPGSKFSC